MNLYKHQIEALKATENKNRCAYYLDMGLGKTFVGSEKMIRLGAKTNLLICQKSKIRDWIEHFIINYKCHKLNLTVPKEFKIFVDYCINSKFTGEFPVIGIINYELAWRRPELLNLKEFTLMLDESSLIQNKQAKQTKFILKLKPKNVILLSGSPVGGKYENLWTQAHLLGWEISDRLFQQTFVNWEIMLLPGNIPIKVVNKKNPYKNVERLKSKLREHGAVFLKTEECFGLPEQTFIDVRVPVPKQYRKFMKDSIVTIKNVELVGDTTLTKRIMAREICSMYSDEKREAFRDLLESTNDRLIVFYNFTGELEEMESVANDLNRPFSIVNGKIKRLDEYESCSNSLTFVQYQAGSMGLNLQQANKIVYYSPTERCELYQQSLKRIHRIGQSKPCFYYRMISENSVEEKIYAALERGVDFTNELFLEGIEEYSRRKTV